MTEQLKGPKSYFPSIEAKYGRTIDEWMEILLVHVFRSEHGGA